MVFALIFFFSLTFSPCFLGTNHQDKEVEIERKSHVALESSMGKNFNRNYRSYRLVVVT